MTLWYQADELPIELSKLGLLINYSCEKKVKLQTLRLTHIINNYRSDTIKISFEFNEYLFSPRSKQVLNSRCQGASIPCGPRAPKMAGGFLEMWQRGGGGVPHHQAFQVWRRGNLLWHFYFNPSTDTLLSIEKLKKNRQSFIFFTCSAKQGQELRYYKYGIFCHS